MAQFLNLEGRDTFASTENIEKVKILNGGIPQNSDLNEQSAIDELRAKRIIADGFGDGKLSPVDFFMESEGITKLKLTRGDTLPENVYGRLYQDGNRFELRSTLDEIVVALSSNTDKHILIPTPGSEETYRGRVYVVHAKQDYLDPAKKLTVRDRAENSIQINTASREQRVYDFYIDWGIPLSGNPQPQASFAERLDRFDGQETFILDGAAGHVFEDKLSFAASALYGFEGQLYFIGNVVLTTGSLLVDLSTSELFKGKPRVTQYTGGDLWHRQDTELAGLVYQKVKSLWSGTPTYDGLRVSEYPSSTGDFNYTVNLPSVPSDYISTWHFHKLSVNTMQETFDELLHIPALNAYFAMYSDLLLDIFDVGDTADVDIIKAVLDDLDLDETEEPSTHILALVVRGDPNVKTNYHLIDLGSDGHSNHANIYNTNEQLVLCTFRLVVDNLDTGTHEADIVFTYPKAEEVPPSFITDRRRYQINSPEAIGSPTEDVQIPLGTAVYHFEPSDGVSFSAGDEVLIYSVGEDTELIGRGTITYINDDTTDITVELTYGVDRLGYTDSVRLVNALDSSEGFTSQSIQNVPEQSSPDINMHVAVGRNIHTEGVTQSNHPKNNNDTVLAPITLSSSLARIRGAFAALLPSYWQSVFNDLPTLWNKIHVFGIRLPFIQMFRPGTPAQIDFVAPTSDITNTGVGQINFNYGTTTKTFKRGLQRFITMYRTLRDDSGYKNPMIYMLGVSTANEQWAPFMEVNHSGNNSTITYPTTGAAALLGGMLALRGKNSIVACEYGADYRTRNPLSDSATYQKAVIIDGQTGEAIVYKLRAQIAEIITLSVSGNASVAGTLAVTGAAGIGGALVVASTGLFLGYTLSVGIPLAGRGQVVLEAANSGSPASVLTLKNDAGPSVTVKASDLAALTGGGNTALHSHTTVSVLQAPLATVIANAKNPITDGDGYNKYEANSAYLFCDGQEVLITDYPLLYAIILDKFGTAAALKFKLPDFRGTFLRGADQGSGNDPDCGQTVPNGGRSVTGSNAQTDVGSTQVSAFKNIPAGVTVGGEGAHTHVMTDHHTSDSGSDSDAFDTADHDYGSQHSTASAGGHNHALPAIAGGSATETRPENVAINYYIKGLEG